MLAAITEQGVTPAQPELGSDCCCCCPTAPGALLSFKCAPLQPSLPHLVCVIATDEAFQASLAASVMQAPLASWDIHFPSTPVSNQWIPEILLCLPCSSLASGDLSSVLPLLLPWVPAGIHKHSCVSADCLVPRGWSATQALSTSYSGFTLSLLYCCKPLIYPSTVMLTACLSAYPGVCILLLIGLLLSWCSVPGRIAARAWYFQADISSCLWGFAPGSLLSFLPFTYFVGTMGKRSCAQIPMVLNYLNFAAVHYNPLSEKCTLHFMISALAWMPSTQPIF